MEVGGCVQVAYASRSHSEFFLENHLKIALNQYSVLIFWISIPYVHSVCIIFMRKLRRELLMGIQ